VELALIALLGGCLALDATSVGQFMLSRPLVAGALTGWMLGDPALGLLIGTVLELYLLVSFPSGGARFPEGTTATVVAVATASASSAPGALPVAIAIGLVWGQVGGFSITALRRANGFIVPEPADSRADARRVATAHLGAVGLDFVRGALITGTGVAIGRLIVVRLAEAWPIGAREGFALMLAGGAVSVGILLHDLGGFRERRVLFVAGLALGIVGVRLL
jgi:mannose/fructose/N-acetylgalactosamine-specific phosphotransferase system component IIC